MATADSIVRARIDTATKQEAAIVLAGMGLSVSDAIRLMLRRVAREHTLPFDVRPNAETIAAIEEARRDGEKGLLPRFDTTADLMAHLNAED
jgi:DNA-damage-inducible protein J